MTKKRFEINNLAKKGNMSFWDNENKTILNTSHTLDLLNKLNEENKQLKQLLQAIISKEFELSSDDNDYDPLSEFFNNEVSISQIEVDINVEKED